MKPLSLPGIAKSVRMPRDSAIASWRPGALAFALPVLLLAACGGGGGDALSPAGVPSPAPAPPPAAPPASAPDALNGKALYQQHCSVCHGQWPDARVLSAAGDGSVVVQAIGLVRIMNFLSASIRPAEAQDIGAWLEDPRWFRT